jgi:hypothetical protein
MKRKKGVRQMVSIDDLPYEVRDAVLAANGQPVKITMPKIDTKAPGYWRKSDRERKIL